MVVLEFEQGQNGCDTQVIKATTPKRKIGIKIFIPHGQCNLWHIAYEDGRAVEGLSDSIYTSRFFAMRAFEKWERLTKKTKDAKQYELFGDKQPPILKRKRVKNAATA